MNHPTPTAGPAVIHHCGKHITCDPSTCPHCESEQLFTKFRDVLVACGMDTKAAHAVVSEMFSDTSTELKCSHCGGDGAGEETIGCEWCGGTGIECDPEVLDRIDSRREHRIRFKFDATTLKPITDIATDRIEHPIEGWDDSEQAVNRAMKRFHAAMEIGKLKERVKRLEYENGRLERRAKKYAAQLDAKG